MVYRVENLTCYQGRTEIDQTTQQPSGALTLRCTDDDGNDLSIRVPDDVWALDENGSRVTDATYFVGKKLTAVGAITFFAPNEDDPTNGYYQIKLCAKDDLTIVSSGE